MGPAEQDVPGNTVMCMLTFMGCHSGQNYAMNFGQLSYEVVLSCRKSSPAEMVPPGQKRQKMAAVMVQP